MRELGVSIYPENANVEEIKDYLSLAAKYGFTRVFTCLISAKGNKDKVIEEFKEIIDHADRLAMKTIAGVSPSVFDEYNISHTDLKFFKDMKLWGQSI
nr:MupG family TIM beta-alpha barrel fold protein [Alkaliphilus metalliredigens]